MSFFSGRFLALACLLAALRALALDNGLERTPAMGWNPYNAFSCDTSLPLYEQQADAMVSRGLLAAGYQYLIIDCGWQGTARDANGHITALPSLYPDGLAPLGTYLHNKGLKFGVYSDAGFFSCGPSGRVGSLGFEMQDAATFASWGADYLKYDNCFSDSQTNGVDHFPTIDIKPHYAAMRDALAAQTRPIAYAICEWGVDDPARWAPTYGNSWRMSDDINDSWNDILRIINQVVPITGFSGPGAHSDLDLLEVGNSGMTVAEQQTHFAFWAAVKSPLIVSTNLTAPSADTLGILLNPRIIALNQDPLGVSISFRRRYTDDHDVWAGPLSDGSTVVLIINWMPNLNSVAFKLSDVGFGTATLTNLITGASIGAVPGVYSATLDPHGVLVLKLTKTTPAPVPSYTFYTAPNFVLAGGATTRTVNTTTVAGFVGNNMGTLTINNVDGGSSGGTRTLSIDYINADYVFAFNTAPCQNCRNAFISVNGGAPTFVNFPISGQTWDLQFQGFLVDLPGFKPGTTNTVVINNPDGWAPDFVRVGVAV